MTGLGLQWRKLLGVLNSTIIPIVEIIGRLKHCFFIVVQILCTFAPCSKFFSLHILLHQ